VTSLPDRSARVNPVAEREREFLTRGLATAIARSRYSIYSVDGPYGVGG
jgi:hypothetical protein